MNIARRLVGWSLPAILILTVASSVCAQQPSSAAPASKSDKRFESLGIGGGGQMYGMGLSPHDKDLMHVSCDMGTFYISQNGAKSWDMLHMLQMVGTTSCRPAYHPTDPNIVYMPYYRDTLKQLRISRDKGLHWEVLCDDVPWGNPSRNQKNVRDKYEVGVIAINIDPATDKLMFASTAEGLYRSTDGGRSFTRCDAIEGQAVWVHVVPTSDVKARTCIAASAKGVYVSNDSGKTWKQQGKALPEGAFGMAAATDSKTGKTTCYVVCGDKGVFVSTDGGESFAQCSQGLGDKSSWRFVSMSQVDPAVAYVTNFGSNWGVFKTADSGKTWQKVFTQNGKNITWGWLGLDHTKGFGGRANSLTVSPIDPDLAVWVNTGELFVTRDGGKTWTERCSDYYGPDDKNRKGGQKWGGIGLEVALPTDCIFDPFDANRVYLIYGDIGFLISEDRGKSWRRSTKGIPADWVNRMWQMIPDPSRKGVLYAACAGAHGSMHNTDNMKYKGGVVMSTDAGESWKVISTGLPEEASHPTDLAVDFNSPAEARTLYTVFPTKGVYKSTDGGKSWQHKSKGLGRPENMNAEQLHLAADGTLYCLVIGRSRNWDFKPFPPGGLWKSTDGAETWTEVTQGLEVAYPSYFAVDPRNPQRIFLGSTQAPSKEPAGLWQTTDGGKSWKKVLGASELNNPDKLFSYVHSGPISFHPADKNIIYYSTKTHGLWFTRDDGKSWKRLEGIPRLATHKVVADPRDPKTIYVTSVGLWKGPAQGYGD